MKKLTTIFALLTLFVLSGLMVSVTYASGSDLFDDTQISGNSYEVELLANSEYRLIVPAITSNDLQDLDPRDESIEFFTYDSSLDLYYSYQSSPDTGSTLLSGIDVTFNTGTSATYFEMNFSGFNEDIKTVYDGSTYDIQLLWISTTGQDEVPPEYTYSNVSVDTPYYDLVTASEIQAQLQAVDDEDGDVTDRIQVYEDHYTSITPKVVGDEYYIMFMVDDTAGNSAYLRVDINVIDDVKPQLIYDSVTYSDEHTFNWTWYDDDYTPEDMTIPYNNFMMAEVTDAYYGDFGVLDPTPSGWFMNMTGDNPDPVTPGTYNYTMIFQDPSGNQLDLHFNVTVLDNQAPVITGSSSIDVEIVGLNINDILALYSATDSEDGSASVVVDNTNTWDYNNPTLGTFTLVLSSTDSMGKETLKNVTVNVVDTTDPVIKIDGIPSTSYSHTVYMSDTTTLQALIDSITVTDAYYGDLTAELVVPAYPSFTVPGTTILTLTVEDASGNSSSLALTVTVADDIAPIINGATKIVKGRTEILTLSNILSTLSSTDNVDGALSLELVSDGYSGNSAIIGSYLVKYKATDTAGNIKYHDVRVWVVDNTAPAWIVNDYFVNLGINEVMTRAELVSLLQASGMIGSDISYTVTFVTDEYTGNEEIEGAYQVVMNVTYEDGSEAQLQVQLNVPEGDEGDVIIVDPDTPQTGLGRFLTNTVNFFKNAWESIKSAALWGWDKLVWAYDHILVPVYEFIFVKDSTDPIPSVTTTSTSSSTTSATTSELPLTTTSSPIQQA